MLQRLKKKVSPATVIATLALIVALGGTAVAGGVLNKKKVNNIITNRASSLSVASAKSADSAKNADSANVAKNVFGETQGVNGSILTPGVTVQHTGSGAGSTFTYTFPRNMVNCIPVVTGNFTHEWTAFQSGTAPTNVDKITVNQGGIDSGHELVVVCPN